LVPNGAVSWCGDESEHPNLIPIVKPNFTKTQALENPLLQVPPAGRGNRTSAPCTVPLAKRGEPHGLIRVLFSYQLPPSSSTDSNGSGNQPLGGAFYQHPAVAVNPHQRMRPQLPEIYSNSEEYKP
jgi:hypothetical protein